MASTATLPPNSGQKPATSRILNRRLRDSRTGRIGVVLFGVILAIGVVFVISRLVRDLSVTHPTSAYPYVLLGIALLIALGFEFVNGFHDTANAVATVIYTHSLEPHIAVVISGIFNFLGVLTSSGAVAYTIVSLLPVELILKVSKGAGFSMVFALLVAAIIWNLGTWYMGLPSSSSHTMIGSVAGVGLMNGFLEGNIRNAGLDWEQVAKVGKALFFSPLIGFLGAYFLLWIAKRVLTNPRLFKAPEGEAPPPFWMRCLLIGTCSGVSFAHGSNDGQKGMGLIMLILVGTVPPAYALNHAIDNGSLAPFTSISQQASGALSHYIPGPVNVADPNAHLADFIRTRHYDPSVLAAAQQVMGIIPAEAAGFGSLGNVPGDMQSNVRNQMYLVSETLRLVPKNGGPTWSAADKKTLTQYTSFLDRSTKYIPTWVKVAVALALGLGTMIGWKRIVVTVGERIGKEHLTYSQGAAAELVAMSTIFGFDRIGMPVSTTHVLSSGVAGTMAANGSGLQVRTLRNIALAWLLTLPSAALLSGSLYWLFTKIPT